MFKNWLLFDANDGGGGNGNGNGNAGDDATVTMKQSELNRSFAERAKRAAESAVGELLKSIGLKDAAELKAKLEAAAKLETENLSAAEKATKEAADAKAAAERAAKERDDALAKANERLLRGAVLGAAADFNDPNDAWLYVDRSKLKVNDAGDVEGVEAAVAEVKKAKPYLLKQQSGSTNNNSGNRGRNDGQINQQQVLEAKRSSGMYSGL